MPLVFLILFVTTMFGESGYVVLAMLGGWVLFKLWQACDRVMA